MNRLSLYKNLIDDGKIDIKENNNYNIEIICSDFQKNKTVIKIPVEGVKSNLTYKKLDTTGYKIKSTDFNEFKLKNVKVAFPKNTFYEDCFLDLKVDNGIAHIHQPIIPLDRKYTLTFGISHLSDSQKKHVYISNVDNPKYPKYVSTKKKENKVYTSTKSLGSYSLSYDLSPPSIRAINFKSDKWLTKNKTLRLKIRDKESGIRDYTATIDDRWILMEYDYKRGILSYDFSDHKLIGKKHIFKIMVSDNVGNTKTMETTFFR